MIISIIFHKFTSNIDKVLNSSITRYFDEKFTEYDGSISLWHFNSNATILYQAIYENEIFDKIGYLKENDNIWFNMRISTFYNYAPIIECVMGRFEE